MGWRWPGPRGEAYVAVQFVLITLIVLSPCFPLPGLPAWPAALRGIAHLGGILLLLGSLAFVQLAAHQLGRSLTPLPKPKEGASLVSSGVYAKVRHPIYTGILGMGLGWAAAWRDPQALLLTAGLYLLFDRKAAREELWLLEAYPDYAEYRRKVPRLIPKLF